MLSEFLLPDSNFLEEFMRVIIFGILLLGTLSFAFHMIVQIFQGKGFYYKNMFERFSLLIAATFVWTLLIGFVGFGFYNVMKTFVAYQYAESSKDAAVVKKYYDIKPKYDDVLEFTLKEPFPYSYVLKKQVVVPILHKDSKEYQVVYNEHIYKIEK